MGGKKTAPLVGMLEILDWIFLLFNHGESPFGRIFFYLFQVSSKQIQEMYVFLYIVSIPRDPITLSDNEVYNHFLIKIYIDSITLLRR